MTVKFIIGQYSNFTYYLHVDICFLEPAIYHLKLSYVSIIVYLVVGNYSINSSVWFSCFIVVIYQSDLGAPLIILLVPNLTDGLHSLAG